MNIKKILACGVVTVGLLGATASAHATLATGDMSIVGFSFNLTPGPSVSFAANSGIHFTQPGTAGAASGTFAPLNGASVTMHDFTYSPITLPVAPLWNVTVGGTTYSYDLTSAAVVGAITGTAITIEGSGLIHVTGLQDTVGAWTFTGNRQGQSFSYSGSLVSQAANVPEPATLGLFGIGLLGLGLGAGRRLRKS